MAALQSEFAAAKSEISDADKTKTAVTAALTAVERFAEIQVDADDAGAGLEATVEAYIGDLSKTKDSITKTMLMDAFKSQLNELEKNDPDSFVSVLQRDLTGVVKKVTTDRSTTEETEYVLKFESAQNITVPRSVLTNERKLWQAYTSAQVGEYPDRPGIDEDEWDNFVGDTIAPLEEVEREEGPRTAALHALENHVKGSTPYGNVPDALEQNGVYVDAEPPEHDEVRVPREAVASITNTHEISDRALQAEISARGLSSPVLSGDKVSQSTTVNGRWQTFWCLSGEHFDEFGPEYEEEAQDHLDRMSTAPAEQHEWPEWMLHFAAQQQGGGNTAQQSGQAPGSTKDGNAGVVNSDDADDDESPGYGRMGSFGPDEGGDDA